MTEKNMMEKDEYGLYIHAENYHKCRDNVIASEIFHDREKLKRIPKWIRVIFNAI